MLTSNLYAVSAHYLIDAGVILALIVFSVLGAKKGFIGCLFGILTSVLALVLAFVFANNFIEWTNGIFGLEENIGEWIAKKLSAVKGMGLDVSSTGLEEALKNANLPGFIASAIADEFGGKTLAEGTTLAMLAGDKIASILCLILSGLIVYILVKLIMKLLTKILNGVANKFTLVGGVNRLLGAIVGFIKGLFILCAILSVLALFPSDSITRFLDNTLFVGALYNENPLSYLLTWLVS